MISLTDIFGFYDFLRTWQLVAGFALIAVLIILVAVIRKDQDL